MGVIDIPQKVGREVLGVPIIATEEELSKYVDDVDFIVTVGFVKDPAVRNRIFNHIKSVGGRPGTIIASTAHVSPYAKIGAGTVVLHGACVNADAIIGDNVIVNTLSNIDHDAVVGDNCHISTCASLNGMSEVGDNSFIGSQAVVCQCVKICNDVVVGAGGVVIKDISVPGVYVGSPARRIVKD